VTCVTVVPLPRLPGAPTPAQPPVVVIAASMSHRLGFFRTHAHGACVCVRLAVHTCVSYATLTRPSPLPSGGRGEPELPLGTALLLIAMVVGMWVAWFAWLLRA
jgi:hypothetical protein